MTEGPHAPGLALSGRPQCHAPDSRDGLSRLPRPQRTLGPCRPDNLRDVLTRLPATLPEASEEDLLALPPHLWKPT